MGRTARADDAAPTKLFDSETGILRSPKTVLTKFGERAPPDPVREAERPGQGIGDAVRRGACLGACSVAGSGQERDPTIPRIQFTKKRKALQASLWTGGGGRPVLEGDNCDQDAHPARYMIQGHGKHPRNMAYTYQDLGGDQVPTQLANSPATSPRPLVARPSRMQKETLTNVKSFNYTRGNMVELNMEDGDRKEVLLEVEPEPVPAGPRWQRAPAATEEKLPGVGHTAGKTPGRWSLFAVADD